MIKLIPKSPQVVVDAIKDRHGDSILVNYS